MAPAFTFYILLLPAKNEVPKIKEGNPDNHITELQIKNSSLVSDLGHTLLESWVFKTVANK